MKVEPHVASVLEVVCRQPARHTWEVEAQAAIFEAVGTHGGIGLGKAAVVIHAAIGGWYVFQRCFAIAFEIACGGERGDEEEGED